MPQAPRRDNTSPSVLRRAMDVLGAFDRDHPQLTLSDLARRSGLPLSTTFRLVAELAELGALVRDADRSYRLGPRLVDLALLAGAAAMVRAEHRGDGRAA